MRTFIAVPVPGLGRSEAPAHLTLRFLGEVVTERVGPIGQAVESAVRPLVPFTMVVRGVGAFPSEHRPRIVWAAVAQGHDELVDLARRLDESLTGIGFPRERERFVPHLTLFRVRTPDDARRAQRALVEDRDREFARLVVDRVELVESVLSRSGARHSTLGRFSLAGDPPTPASTSAGPP